MLAGRANNNGVSLFVDNVTKAVSALLTFYLRPLFHNLHDEEVEKRCELPGSSITSIPALFHKFLDPQLFRDRKRDRNYPVFASYVVFGKL